MAIDRKFIQSANLDLTTKLVLGTLCDTIDTLLADGGYTSTATSGELDTLVDVPVAVTTTATPATGTCGVQFVFKNAAGTTISHAIAGRAYFSNSTGLALANATSAAVLTNGAWSDTRAGYEGQFVTTAAGLLGVTVTAGAGTYYITFVLPNGKLLTSSALVVN